MQVQHSRPETDLRIELSGLGINKFLSDEQIVFYDKPMVHGLHPFTVPDGVCWTKNICYYVDGIVHNHGRTLERDQERRGWLRELGWDVHEFKIGVDTPREWALELQEALRF
jgi:hypothetical protein